MAEGMRIEDFKSQFKIGALAHLFKVEISAKEFSKSNKMLPGIYRNLCIVTVCNEVIDIP